MQTLPDASALPVWRKSSFSDNGHGGCIEVSDGYRHGIPVRDSKNPQGPAIIFETSSWSAFVAAVRGGDLDA